MSWLLQGRSHPDSRRDWRPSPRSETPAGPLDGGISSEPGMTPQLGKSILLPTAASSDSSGSKVQFERKQEKKKREEETSVKTAAMKLHYANTESI